MHATQKEKEKEKEVLVPKHPFDDGEPLTVEEITDVVKGDGDNSCVLLSIDKMEGIKFQLSF